MFNAMSDCVIFYDTAAGSGRVCKYHHITPFVLFYKDTTNKLEY